MHHSKTEKDPVSLIRRYQRAKERRGNWEGHWAYWYHKTAIGHAVGSDVKTDITWHGDRRS